MKRLMVGLLAGCLMATMLPGVVAAQTAWSTVRIESDVTFALPDYFPNYGDFEASGDAVDDGIVCEAGSVLDTDILFGDPDPSGGLQISAVKEFTCEDGSGTFVMNLRIDTEPDGSEVFTWMISSGTGDYAGLLGSGTGNTIDATSEGNTNIYDGSLID